MLAALLCDESFHLPLAACTAVVISTAFASRAFTSYQRAHAAWQSRGITLQQAVDAQTSQAEAHDRDHQRLVAEVADLKAQLEGLGAERRQVRDAMKASAERTERLAILNATLCSDVDSVAADTESLIHHLTAACTRDAGEAQDIFQATAELRRESDVRRVDLMDCKWKCDREVALVTARAESVVANALGQLDAAAESDTSATINSEDLESVDDGLAADAVRAHARYIHLDRTAEAIGAELKRVWTEEIPALQARVRTNGQALGQLGCEAHALDSRDRLVDCCVELDDEAAEAEAAAEDAEEEVWSRSVQRTRADHERSDVTSADL